MFTLSLRRVRRVVLPLVVLLALATAPPASAHHATFNPLTDCEFQWDRGDGTSNWTDWGNWDPTGMPTYPDDACVLAGGPTQHMQTNGLLSARTVTVNGNWEMSTGTFSADSAWAQDPGAEIELNGAVNTISDHVALNSGTFFTFNAGGGTLNTGTALSFVGPGTVRFGTTTTLPDIATLEIGNGTTLLVSGADISIGTTDVVVQSGGKIQFTDDFDLGSAGGTITVESGGQIVKSGTTADADVTSAITAPLENLGTVANTAAGGIIDLSSPSGTSSGTFSATAAATTRFIAGSWAWSGASVTGAGDIEITGATVTASGIVTLDGLLRQTGGAYLGTHTLSGTGTYDWVGGALGDNGQTLTTDDITVQLTGSQTLGGTLDVNNAGGTWEFKDSANLTFAGDVVNNGTFVTTGSPNDYSVITINGTFTNNGLMFADVESFNVEVGTGTMTNIQDSGATLSGGTYRINGPSGFRMIALPAGAVTKLDADVVLEGLSAQLRNPGNEMLSTVTNITATASLDLDATAVAGMASPLANNGLLDIDGTFTAANVNNAVGGTIRGSGLISGNVATSGTVEPNGSSTGDLDISGSFTLQASGTLAIQIAGPGALEYDHFDVGGLAALNGTIAVDTTGYTLGEIVHTDSFNIVQAAGGAPSGSPTLTPAGLDLPGEFLFTPEENTGDNHYTLSVDDNVNPGATGAPTSLTHVVGTPDNDTTPTIDWTAAADPGSGVAGYSVSVDHTSGTLPNTSVDQAGLSYTTGVLADDDDWYVHVRAIDNEGNAGAATEFGPIVIDDTDPAVDSFSVTELTGNQYQHRSSGTLYFNPTQAGSFKLAVVGSDASGIQGVTFADYDEAGTSWTPNSATPTDTSSPYEQTYVWAAPGTADAGSQLATVTDNAGNTATGAGLTLTPDTSAPSGGTLDYTSAQVAASGASAVITFAAAGSDTGSGLSGHELQRATATLNGDGTCGAFGGYAAVGGANPTSTYTDSALAAASCYQWRLVTTDNVGNAETVADGQSDVVKVLAVPAPPAPPTPPPAPPAPPAPTAGNDNVLGTALADVIKGLAGNDIIKGLGGNDNIDGGPGNDNVDGGAGNDVIVGGSGNDKLTGGPGKDTFKGNGGNDTIKARDKVKKEKISCGAGKDTVVADKGDKPAKDCENVKLK